MTSEIICVRYFLYKTLSVSFSLHFLSRIVTSFSCLFLRNVSSNDITLYNNVITDISQYHYDIIHFKLELNFSFTLVVSKLLLFLMNEEPEVESCY